MLIVFARLHVIGEDAGLRLVLLEDFVELLDRDLVLFLSHYVVVAVCEVPEVRLSPTVDYCVGYKHAWTGAFGVMILFPDVEE